MGKKDKKQRSETEAGLVSVQPEAVSAAGVGEPTADAGDVSMAVDGDSSVVKKAKKDKKEKKEKKKEKEATTSSKKDKDPSKKEKSKERAKELEIPADALSPIAHPLAGRKLNKSTLKLVKRGECCLRSSWDLLVLPSNLT
jgi:H/ACA ribonucleoprotein complex subunit 2